MSRGYKRKTSGFREVLVSSKVEDVGDEPLQFKKKFPNVSSSSNVSVIADSDPQFNCVAWSLGIDYAFITSGLSKMSVFIKTYKTAADSDHGGK